jgi:hypothetical protein
MGRHVDGDEDRAAAACGSAAELLERLNAAEAAPAPTP